MNKSEVGGNSGCLLIAVGVVMAAGVVIVLLTYLDGMGVQNIITALP